MNAPSSCSLSSPRWNPYLVGSAIGILSWALFLVVDKPLGMSTEVSKWSGCVTSLFTGWDTVKDNAYWASTTPKWGYSTVFTIATLAGAFLSAKLSGSFHWEKIPSVWRDRFGSNVALRFGAAFLGGAIILFGARLAGGCTSGHGISGTLQFAVSSWTFFASMLVTGLLTAALMFRPGKS